MELVDQGVTERVVRRCLERGLLLGWTLHSDTLVRLAPPLNLSFDVLDTALGIILESLEEED